MNPPFSQSLERGKDGHAGARHLVSAFKRLKPGGRLVAIVGDEPMMRATVVTRNGDSFTTTEPWDCNAPRLAGFAEPSHFAF